MAWITSQTGGIRHSDTCTRIFGRYDVELPPVPGTGGRGATTSWMDDPETRGGYTISTRAEGA